MLLCIRYVQKLSTEVLHQALDAPLAYMFCKGDRVLCEGLLLLTAFWL